MIYVDRASVLAPEALIQLGVPALRELESHVRGSGRQRELTFDRRIYGSKDVMRSLHLLFEGRCAFCESYVSYGGEVLHFRPMSRASNMDGKVWPEHYWWLAYEWSNLYLSCTPCFKSKGSRFPVRGARAKAGSRGEQLDHEYRFLVDPCTSKAGGSLELKHTGVLSPLDMTAEVTIDVFALNRPELVRLRRLQWVENIKRFWDVLGKVPLGRWTAASFLEEVRKRFTPGESFVGLTLRQATDFLSRRQRAQASSIRPESDDDEAILQEDYERRVGPPPSDWLRKIEIENFRAIQHLTLEFPEVSTTWSQENLDRDQQEPWIVLLGDNGFGKSSVLKAIALALASPVELKRLAQRKHSPLTPRSVMTEGRGQAQGRIRLWFSRSKKPLEMTFGRHTRNFKVTGVRPDMPVLGYGSTRLLPAPSEFSRLAGSVRVGSLFDPVQQLGNGERWLADPKAVNELGFELLSTDLKGLLGLEPKDYLTRRKGRLTAKLFRKTLPVRDLSDGFQSVLALALDMMRTFGTQTIDMRSVEALVLIDEIETHLHPTWKARIVRDLRKLFPRTRFIVTTHDPLCVQGLAPGELHVLTRKERSKRVELRKVDVPPGLRADQILTGEWFELGSTRDPGTLRLMKRHSELLLIQKRVDTQEAEKRDIEAILRKRLGRFGDTPYEQAGLRAYAELAPKSAPITSEVDQERLRARVRELLPLPEDR